MNVMTARIKRGTLDSNVLGERGREGSYEGERLPMLNLERRADQLVRGVADKAEGWTVIIVLMVVA